MNEKNEWMRAVCSILNTKSQTEGEKIHTFISQMNTNTHTSTNVRHQKWLWCSQYICWHIFLAKCNQKWQVSLDFVICLFSLRKVFYIPRKSLLLSNSWAHRRKLNTVENFGKIHGKRLTSVTKGMVFSLLNKPSQWTPFVAVKCSFLIKTSCEVSKGSFSEFIPWKIYFDILNQ